MKRNKYGAVGVMYRGIKMRSKLERSCAMILDGNKWPWVYNKRIEIYPKIWHRPDFICQFADGSCIIVEAKGKRLGYYKIQVLLTAMCRANDYGYYLYTAKKGMVKII